MESTALLIAASLNAGTVLAITSLGLLINEKAGIVNLGAEDMTLCAALAGFATVVHTGSTEFVERHTPDTAPYSERISSDARV